jgi:hypothetical protein
MKEEDENVVVKIISDPDKNLIFAILFALFAKSITGEETVPAENAWDALMHLFDFVAVVVTTGASLYYIVKWGKS